jgi:SagB-type dehydrogenase family enzyme
MRHATVTATALLLASCALGPAGGTDAGSTSPAIASLPAPELDGDLSLEAALAARRSVRSFGSRPLTEAEVGQLLWAAQGVTSAGGGRTAPSAGATYPLELYVATAAGLSRYHPAEHGLERLRADDVRTELAAAGSDQSALVQAPAIFVVTAIAERTEERYGSRAERYVQLEAGHAAQNLLLQAVALELGAVPIGSFDDDAVATALDLPGGAMPLYLIPVGEPAE